MTRCSSSSWNRLMSSCCRYPVLSIDRLMLLPGHRLLPAAGCRLIRTSLTPSSTNATDPPCTQHGYHSGHHQPVVPRDCVGAVAGNEVRVGVRHGEDVGGGNRRRG